MQIFKTKIANKNQQKPELTRTKMKDNQQTRKTKIRQNKEANSAMKKLFIYLFMQIVDNKKQP